MRDGRVGLCEVPLSPSQPTRTVTQKFSGECREYLFKGSSLPQNLLAGCIFDSLTVKSAFALLLARVTEPETYPF